MRANSQNGTPPFPIRDSGPIAASRKMRAHSQARVIQIQRSVGVIRKTRSNRRFPQITRDENAEPRSPIWIKIPWAVQMWVGCWAVGIRFLPTHCIDEEEIRFASEVVDLRQARTTNVNANATAWMKSL